MKLTRKHKIYLVALATAVVALLVDQVFLDGGQAGQARAESSAQAPPSQAGTSDAPLTLPDPVDEGPSIADRLTEFARTNSIAQTKVPDAFQPGQAWMVSLNRVAEKAEPGNKIAEEFARKHRLESVMRQSSAIVGSRCIRIGETLDGFTLTSVTDDSATFAMGREQVKLILPLTEQVGAKD